MKQSKVLLILSTALYAATGLAQSGPTVTHITGELCDTTIDELMLHRTDMNTSVNEYINIPFKDGRFGYDLYTNGTEVYNLEALKGRIGYYVQFFAEGDTVRIKFFADKAAKWYADTPLNKELLRMDAENTRQIRLLKEEELKMEKEGRDLTPEGRDLKERHEKALAEGSDESVLKAIFEEGERLRIENRLETPEYKAINTQIAKSFKQSKLDKLNYARNHTDPVGLLCLYNAAINSHSPHPMVDKNEVADIYRTHFAGKMPDFHLTEYMTNFCRALEIRAGGKYYDFTAPDIDGKLHRLSDEIKGKVALIDLWASWCAPCRRTSISMIPVYNDYKDKGFTIVGIARESDANDMRLALEKDKYPWLNLIELHDNGRIWQHYGVEAAGRTFLVDREGTILAVSPTAEEVRVALEKILE